MKTQPLVHKSTKDSKMVMAGHETNAALPSREACLGHLPPRPAPGRVLSVYELAVTSQQILLLSPCYR